MITPLILPKCGWGSCVRSAVVEVRTPWRRNQRSYLSWKCPNFSEFIFCCLLFDQFWKKGVCRGFCLCLLFQQQCKFWIPVFKRSVERIQKSLWESYPSGLFRKTFMVQHVSIQYSCIYLLRPLSVLVMIEMIYRKLPQGPTFDAFCAVHRHCAWIGTPLRWSDLFAGLSRSNSWGLRINVAAPRVSTRVIIIVCT